MAQTAEQKREYARAYRAANADRLREKARAWRKANRERHLANKRKVRRLKDGIIGATGETRHGECPVCLKTRKLVLEHDHATGQIRGWLCGGCNRGLGYIGDTLEAAQRLVAYLSPPSPDPQAAR